MRNPKPEARSPKTEGEVWWEVVMAENGSTDGMWGVAEAVAREFAGTERLRVTARHWAVGQRSWRRRWARAGKFGR